MSPIETVDQYLQGLDAQWREVAPGEWGLTVDSAGWPLHIGMAWRKRMLRAQAEVLPADRVSDHELLYRNRGLVLVRYAHTGAGVVWVHGELPEELVTPAWLDRLLGALVDASNVARERARAEAPAL
jgi:hypothetical protein